MLEKNTPAEYAANKLYLVSADFARCRKTDVIDFLFHYVLNFERNGFSISV